MEVSSFVRKNAEYLALAVVICMFLWKAYPLSNSYGPLNSSDFSAHIFKVWSISQNGLQGWNNYWYGGSPLMKHYPPLSYLITSSISGQGIYLAYSLMFDIVLLLIPITFLVFLKKFDFTKLQQTVALLVFSLSPAILVFYKNSNLPFITAFLFSLIFLIYFKNFLDNKTSFLKPALLLIPVLLTHVLMAAFLYISVVIWFLSNYLLNFRANANKKRLYSFLAMLILPAIACSFWYLPFSSGIYSGREGGLSVLSDPIAYTTFTTNQRLDTLGIPRELFLLFAFFFSLSIFASIRKFRERTFMEFFPWLTVSVALFLFLDYKRIAVLLIIPAAILVTYNCRKLLYMLTVPLIVTTIIVYASSSINFGKIPEYPETGNRVIFYDEEKTCPGCSLYSVFLPPINNNEVIIGWLPQSQNTDELFEKRQPYLRKIQNPLQLNYTEFNLLAQAGMLNYIAVSSGSKNFIEYFKNNTAFEQLKEEKGFIVFKAKNQFTYLEINGQAVEADVAKGQYIQANFACKSGTLSIKETYDSDWTIKIDGTPVKYSPNQHGFMETNLEKEGPCVLEMVYMPSII